MNDPKDLLRVGDIIKSTYTGHEDVVLAVNHDDDSFTCRNNMYIGCISTLIDQIKVSKTFIVIGKTIVKKLNTNTVDMETNVKSKYRY